MAHHVIRQQKVTAPADRGIPSLSSHALLNELGAFGCRPCLRYLQRTYVLLVAQTASGSRHVFAASCHSSVHEQAKCSSINAYYSRDRLCVYIRRSLFLNPLSLSRAKAECSSGAAGDSMGRTLSANTAGRASDVSVARRRCSGRGGKCPVEKLKALGMGVVCRCDVLPDLVEISCHYVRKCKDRLYINNVISRFLHLGTKGLL